MHERDHVLVEAIYAAAMATEAWPDLLNLLIKEFDGCSAALLSTDIALPHSALTVSRGLLAEPEILLPYRDYYGALDPAPPTFAVLPVGQVSMTTELFSDSEANHFEFFNDFFSPAGFLDSLGVTLVRNGRQAAVLGIQRDKIGGAFGAAERQRLTMLVPHLQRALQLHEKLGHHRAKEEALTFIIDRLAAGVFVVDREMRVLHMNRAAVQLAARNDGLSVRRGGVLALTSPGAHDLERLVALASSGVESGITSIRRENGRPYSALVAPLPGAQDETSDRPAVLVIVSEGGQLPPGLEVAIAARFGLTQGETELLMSLLAGRTLQEHCAGRGTSLNTGKFHLKALFAKTETSRQAELVRVTLDSLGIIRYIAPPR